MPLYQEHRLRFVVASSTPNSFRSFLFPVNHLLSSGKGLLRETVNKGHLSTSLESTVFLDFTHQDIISVILLEFTCKINDSLPILIFMIFQCLQIGLDHFFLFNYQMKYTDKTILYKTTFVNLIPVCPVFSYCIT